MQPGGVRELPRTGGEGSRGSKIPTCEGSACTREGGVLDPTEFDRRLDKRIDRRHRKVLRRRRRKIWIAAMLIGVAVLVSVVLLLLR
jgi:hypothetical protein